MKYFRETERGVEKEMRSIQRGRDEKAGRPFRATRARKRADRSEKVDFRCRFSEWGFFHDIASIYRHRKNLNIYLLTVSIFLRLSPSFFVRAHLFLPSSCFLPPFLHTLTTDTSHSSTHLFLLFFSRSGSQRKSLDVEGRIHPSSKLSGSTSSLLTLSSVSLSSMGLRINPHSHSSHHHESLSP